MILAIFKDDSLRETYSLTPLSVGFAALNQRLNLDYPLNGDKSHSISFAGIKAIRFTSPGDKSHTNSFAGIKAALFRFLSPGDKSMSEWGFPKGIICV